MKLIELTKEQTGKLLEMCNKLYFKDKIDENVTYWLQANWLEVCLYYLLPRVAEIHGKQPYTTKMWSVHMVKQKIINELDYNPIDTLYDIWKHPEKYAQSL